MDTLTHTLMGGALVGAATLDPSIDALSTSFIITIIGASQIPDIDTVLKLKNNTTYITHHRGITHSLPFTFFVWPVLVTLMSVIAFNLPLHIYLWVQLAVFLHVLVDIFNSYGTQALRPFNQQWIQLGWVNTIDLFIISIHVIYFLLWIWFPPGPMFFVLFSILIIYYIIRYYTKRHVMLKVNTVLNGDISRLFVMPTLNFFKWRIVAIKNDGSQIVGRSNSLNDIRIFDHFNYQPTINAHIKNIIKDDPNFKSFIYFSPVYKYDVTELNTQEVEVRYTDLRYYKNGHYPFVSIMIVDIYNQQVMRGYTGWVFTEKKLQQKLLNH